MSKKSVLVIDDNELFRETVGDLLEEAGYEPLLAESLEEGVSLIDSNEVAVILCDLVMPSDFSGEMDEEMVPEAVGSAMVGLGAMHQLRKSRPDVPIVAMSGVAERDVLQAMERFGANEALRKPFSIKELSSTLSRVLSA
ncbi:response regulator [bacterium]|nr:response regulator [bacterium]